MNINISEIDIQKLKEFILEYKTNKECIPVLFMSRDTMMSILKETCYLNDENRILCYNSDHLIWEGYKIFVASKMKFGEIVLYNSCEPKR